MRLLALVAASAAVALLAACGPCSGSSKVTPTPISQIPSPDLQAEYLPQGDGTFQAVVRVGSLASAGGCLELDPAAQGDLGGVALGLGTPPSGACNCATPLLAGQGPVPAATDGTIVVKDGSGELSVTVPSLFVPATVAIEDQAGAPLSALPRSSRVYLVFAPANFSGIAGMQLTFTPASAAAPAFSMTDTPGGGIVLDGARWYFEVPATAPAGGGVLAVTTSATLEKTSCTATPSAGSTLACHVTSFATRRLSTSVQ